MSVILGIIYALILLLQIPVLLRKKDKKILIIYCVLMGIAILYSYAVFLNIKIPRLTEIIIKVTKPVVKAIYGDIPE